MSELFEDDAQTAPGNAPAFTVSELSGAIKRTLEGEFGFVRVRGEIGRVSRPASGHLYFDLKDDRAVLAAIAWKGQAARLTARPEEGIEVIAIGRITTFPGQSKYQLIVEDLVPAGAGALMAMLEKRKAQLAAEGLFDAGRKKPIPYLPEVIGVITSPSGAVIRDILHRLRDRFPRRVLIWPVAVQGEKCAPEVAAAIAGFNALPADGPIPRPDVLIVARGGGSLEDLWGFNEEIVVRAAAASRIPLISAVGHETDTTLIDYAADLRAPTPTAAAELAVPVRLELVATLDALAARRSHAITQGLSRRGQRLTDLARALPRPEALTATASQRLDLLAERLPNALGQTAGRARARFAETGAHIRPSLLAALTARLGERLQARADRLQPAALTREIGRRQERLDGLAGRLARAAQTQTEAWRARLEALDRMRQTLGYTETLKRGFAVVRAEGAVVTTKAAAETAHALEIEFQDGRLGLGPRSGRRPRPDDPSGQAPSGQGSSGQGSLF